MEPIGRAGKQDRRLDGLKLKLLHDLRWILLAVAALVAVLCLVFGVSTVSGVSMLDTFHAGEHVFYLRVAIDPHRGDIVSVRVPSDEYYIKRVIAVGGDEVDLRDGALYINGVKEEGDYIRGVTEPEDGAVTYPFTVGEDDVFVVGDNREQSVDSRSFGCVNRSQVRGIVHFAAGWLYLRFY